MKVEELDTPALLLDLDILDHNIKSMEDYFHKRLVRMRPHIKTHKCPAIAHKQVAAGAEGIACERNVHLASRSALLTPNSLLSLSFANSTSLKPL
jgi:D-serine deaminase-like pyridoxal phosphate-dependent protein